MTSYFAPSALPTKSFYMYRRDRAGNLINDQYPDYLLVPQDFLTEEEKAAYERILPGKLEAFEQLKVKCAVYEKNLMTEYVDQEGKHIPVTEEWDKRVAEHVRVIIAPSGLVEETYDDDDECASTTSDDSDVSLPRPYLDSSGDFTYTSEEEDESSPLGKRGAPVSQNSSRQDPPSNPQLMSSEPDRSLPEADVQPREPQKIHGREYSPTKSSSAQYNDDLFSGPHTNFLNELFSHVDRRGLTKLCHMNGMPSHPDLNFLKKMATWSEHLLNYEKTLKLENYIHFVKTNEPSVVGTTTDREAAKVSGERDYIRSHLSQILRKTLVERAIILATEMSKPDMAKKLKETYSPELAKVFLKTPTEVFILDNALRKCNEVLGVKAVSRDKVPVASLTSECFVDLKVRLAQQKTQNPTYANKEQSLTPRFEKQWTSHLVQADQHLDDHVMAFKILAENYKENPEAVEILHEHAVCLRHCVPTYAALQAEVQEVTRANQHYLTPAQHQLSTNLLNTLQKFKELSITTIDEALEHLSELLDPEDEVTDDASGSYENDSEEDNNE